MPMRVLIVDDVQDRSQQMVASLQQAGYEVLSIDDNSVAVIKQIDQTQPDVVLINAESAQRDILEHSATKLRGFTTPVIFLDKGIDAESATQASRLGISVYALDDIPADILTAVIQTSIAQFTAHDELKTQVGAAKAQIAEERTIARAKTALVEQGRMTEADAHQWLRKTAMDHNRKLIDIAEAVIAKAKS
jgi:response regulator NasT